MWGDDGIFFSSNYCGFSLWRLVPHRNWHRLYLTFHRSIGTSPVRPRRRMSSTALFFCIWNTLGLVNSRGVHSTGWGQVFFLVCCIWFCNWRLHSTLLIRPLMVFLVVINCFSSIYKLCLCKVAPGYKYRNWALIIIISKVLLTKAITVNSFNEGKQNDSL